MIARGTQSAIGRAAPTARPAAASSRSTPTAIERVEAHAAFDCQSCGACCAYSAEWPRFSLESDADIARIPRDFLDPSGRGMRCIGDRCTALVGVVGQTTSCAAYAVRPDVCRTCAPGDAECLQARRRFGL